MFLFTLAVFYRGCNASPAAQIGGWLFTTSAAICAVICSSILPAILSAIQRQEAACTIMVSHRLASLRGADRILVMDEGKLVEEGTHAELLQAGGLYATMHEQQQAEH